MTPNDDETTRPFATLSDEELLDRLLHAGLDGPSGLPQELMRRGQAVVASLCAWVVDDGLWGAADDVACWAPLHALHPLGAIGDPAARLLAGWRDQHGRRRNLWRDLAAVGLSR